MKAEGDPLHPRVCGRTVFEVSEKTLSPSLCVAGLWISDRKSRTELSFQRRWRCRATRTSELVDMLLLFEKGGTGFGLGRKCEGEGNVVFMVEIGRC